MTPRGPHRRKVWTARALRKRLLNDGDHVYFAILVPGTLATLGNVAALPDQVDRSLDPRVRQLIDAIGFGAWMRDDGQWEGSTPTGLKRCWFGIWRGRWCISGYLRRYDRDHPQYPFNLPALAAFINQLQIAAGALATVYGRPTPRPRSRPHDHCRPL